MNRRTMIALTTGAMIVRGLPAFAQGDPLKAILAEVSADPGMVEDSWQFRESTVSRGVGQGLPSKRALPQIAIDMISAFEISSQKAYEQRYRRPIWPGGFSGVTIGIGYDLCFANSDFLDRDWPMLSRSDRALLLRVTALKGVAARNALPIVHSVDISWDPARVQYLKFLPYPTKQTEDNFQNTALLSQDSFGALVSLVYNRGAQANRNDPTRAEMLNVKRLMASRDFSKIPDQIRAMKRLWTTKASRGLLRRRDAEALLFEQGLHNA